MAKNIFFTSTRHLMFQIPRLNVINFKFICKYKTNSSCQFFINREWEPLRKSNSSLYLNFNAIRNVNYKPSLTRFKLEISDFEFFSENHLSISQWEDVIQNKLFNNMNRPIKREVFDSFFCKECLERNKIALCISYYNYCKSKGSDLNFLSQSYFLMLIAKNVSSVGESLFQEIYDLLKKEDHLPCEVVCRIIAAVSLTKFWKDGFHYSTSVINDVGKITHEIDQANNYMARAIIREEGLDNGVSFLQGDLFSSGYKINDDTWIYILDLLESKGRTEENMNKFYTLVLQDKKPINKELTPNIQRALPSGWFMQRVKIPSRQLCDCCGHYLKNVMINKEDIFKLKEACESAVINKEDIFQTTTPAEWKNFQLFLKKSGPFDIVLDGLNLLLSRTKAAKKYLLMVRKSPDTKFLLISRRHTLKELKKFYNNDLPKNLYIFFLDNYTKDDGFLLYAAFYSGLGAQLITRDFLRDHRFLLGDPTLQRYFDNWQKLYQIRWGTPEGIYNYSREPQWTIDGQLIHIPLEDPEGENYYFTHKTDWLCCIKQT